MNEIKIEEALLANDIQAFEDAMNRFTKSHYEMALKIDELNAVWLGTAKEAFIQQYQADCELLNEFRNLLIEMQEAMRFALKEYEQCGKNVNAVVEGIQI